MSSSTYKIPALLCLLMAAIPGSAIDDKKEVKPFVPLYQGIQLGFELSGPASYFLSDSWGYSVKADINLKNKYFPTIEAGFSDYDKTAESGIHFTSSGSYVKAGLNIPLSKNGPKNEYMFYGGLHYGFSAFSYNLDNLSFSGDYWGNNITSFKDEKSVVGWIEGVAGVRVHVGGPISLGWNVLYKSVLNIKNGDHSNPPYIPGYGLNVKPGAGINVHLYYKLPF